MATDILLDDSFDLGVDNGDIAFGESDNQDVELILYSNQGDWKNEPLVGANVQDYILSTDLQGLKKHIKSQLKSDNKAVKKIEIIGSQLNVQI